MKRYLLRFRHALLRIEAKSRRKRKKENEKSNTKWEREKGEAETMAEPKKEAADMDWELSEDFYQVEEGEKELSLEDFMEEGEPSTENYVMKEELQKVVTDVRTVQKLAAEGKSIDEIVQLTGLERQYVYDIQICTQGFHEDDEIAVAHLVMMGL